MNDILPSAGSGDRFRPSRRRSTGRATRKSENVLYVDWKLPARLRKPVREQLTQERAEKRRRREVINFERRPIRTRPIVAANPDISLPGARVQKPTRKFFRTSFASPQDIQTQQRAKLQLAPPPYAGSYLGAPSVPTSVPTQKPVQQNESRRVSTLAMSGERDVPVSLGSMDDAARVSDEELFVKTDNVAAGVTFSLWPGNWFGRKKEKVPVQKTAKKKLILPS